MSDRDVHGVVIGPVPGCPAQLDGHRLAAFADGAVAHPVPGGAGVPGVLLTLEEGAFARLDHVMRSLGGQPLSATVQVDGQAQAARVWCGTDSAGPASAAPDWHPAPALTDALRAALPDILALMDHDPARIARRLVPMLVRAASRLRAGTDPAPHSLRRQPMPGDVQVQAHRQPYASFFAVEEMDLSFRRFDGSLSPVVNRAAFISGDAVTLLPYDPRRDRVLLIEQFRPGPFVRGDTNPWSLEAIAGRIDPGETPEQAGRREAMEEAGLTPGALLPVAGYYPSPAAKIEYLYSYVALCDLPDGIEGVFGVEGEAEDIRGHLIPFDRLMALVASGEVGNGPLILSALWLQRERSSLRETVSPR
ncbi:MAG: tellurium resistance protein [Rhodobacteraceae bacterium PARR1]|nr:MAG: tellurium resistance protein [Rhodobacteraceae bacterium PARR1]